MDGISSCTAQGEGRGGGSCDTMRLQDREVQGMVWGCVPLLCISYRWGWQGCVARTKDKGQALQYMEHPRSGNLPNIMCNCAHNPYSLG